MAFENAANHLNLRSHTKQHVKMSDNENGVAVGEERFGEMPAADVKFLVTCLQNTTGGALSVSLIINPSLQTQTHLLRHFTSLFHDLAFCKPSWPLSYPVEIPPFHMLLTFLIYIID